MSIERSGHDGVANLTLDDGKANAFDFDFFIELDEALDACADAAAVVIAGREGMFSAGLNVKLLGSLDDAGLGDLLVSFGNTMLRLWLEPRPVVAAATGHAIAGGTLLAMVCDHAVAASGDFRWGMTETTIGFPMPQWAATIARGNVRADRIDDLLLPGRIVDAAEAVDVGFADELAAPEQVIERASARARELAELPRKTYAATKRRLRGPAADVALADLTDDTRRLLEER